jgi:chorismate synthase
VAAGGVAKQLLGCFEVTIRSYTRSIGSITAAVPNRIDWKAVEASPVRSPDATAGHAMVGAIDAARAAGDTLGGIFTVVAEGVPPGLGSFQQWDTRLDGLLAQAVVSIPACKAVALGAGFEAPSLPGSQVHDVPVHVAGRGFRHQSNRAGGLEGGVSNGEPIIVHGMMKPISTLLKPMPSVDVKSKQAVKAHYERSDICVVPAAGVVGEAVVALVLANALLEKFGGDSVPELTRNLKGYLRQIGAR